MEILSRPARLLRSEWMAVPKISAFWANAMTVLIGTVLAQALPLAILPVLTRILPAEELGNYFVWFGAVSVLLVVATARLDIAIFSARTQQEVEALLRTVVAISAMVACAALGVTFAYSFATGAFPLPALSAGYYVAGVVLAWVLAVNQTLLAILVYRAEFKRMARAKIFLAVGVSLAQLVLCVVGAGLAGLVYAHVGAASLVTLMLLRELGLSTNKLSRGLNWAEVRATVRTHYRFPLFSLPSDLSNALAAQAPLFLILERFGAAQSAAYALTLRVLAGPVGLLANSVLTAYKEQASREFREAGNCIGAFRRAFLSLSALAVLPFALLGLLAEPAFVIVFGDEWAQAGRIAEILAVMFAFKFVASPLSYTLYIANRQHHDLVWQIVLLVMTVAIFTFDASLERLMVMYSAGYSTLYVAYLGMSYSAARGARQ